MLFRDVIELIQVVETSDGTGGIVETETPRTVFTNKKSIRQTEFYQAAATGLRPEIMFEVRTIDYQEERTLLFDQKQYQIIRTYDKNREITELICSSFS